MVRSSRHSCCNEAFALAAKQVCDQFHPLSEVFTLAVRIGMMTEVVCSTDHTNRKVCPSLQYLSPTYLGGASYVRTLQHLRIWTSDALKMQCRPYFM